MRWNNRDALARRRPVRVGWHVRRLTRGQGQLRRTRAIPSRNVPPVGCDWIRRGVGGRLVGRDAIVEAVLRRREDIAFLVREELLDRVRLLDVRHEPVPDTRPRRVRVAAEHQLPPRGVDLQELGSVGVPAERRMNDQPRGNLLPSVDDLRLAVEGFAQDLLDRLGRIAADRAPRAGLLRWPDLQTGEGIDGVDGPDVPGVEVDRVVEEEVYLLQLLLLDVEHRVRELAELAGMVPVTVAEDDRGDGIGVQADGLHLGAQAVPATRGVPVEDVGELLPA